MLVSILNKGYNQDKEILRKLRKNGHHLENKLNSNNRKKIQVSSKTILINYLIQPKS